MLQRKRKLKKEKTKHRIRLTFLVLIFLLTFLAILIYLNSHYSFGRKIYQSPMADIEFATSNSLENKLNKANIKFNSVSSNEDGSQEVLLKEGGQVILSSKKDLLLQISSLQLILSRLTIEGKKLKTLDFRFDNPVVSF